MTIPHTQSGADSWKPSPETSPGPSRFYTTHSSGYQHTVVVHEAPAAAVTRPCTIYKLVAAPPAQSADSLSDFDALVAEIEGTDEGAEQLAEGARWVGAQFYSGPPTLAALRLARGLSQRQLAEACGLKQPHIARYEAGLHEPRIAIAAKIAHALDVSLDAYYSAWAITEAAGDQPDTTHA